MQYILDHVRAEGEISFVSVWSDSLRQTSGAPTAETRELSTVRRDADDCRINYREVRTSDGAITSDEASLGFPLKSVNTIAVMTFDEEENRAQAFSGREHSFVASYPTIYVVVLSRGKPSDFNLLYFRDEDIANRVARAVTHAVELCGGGDRDLF